MHLHRPKEPRLRDRIFPNHFVKPNEAFAVVVTAYDAQGRIIDQPVQRFAREPEMASVLALGDIQRKLQALKLEWDHLETSITHHT